MKIDDIPAGREMDALIAEKVFGLEVYRSKRDWIQTGMPHMAEWSEAVGYPAYWHPPFELATYVPEYSTNLIAAWEVVEKMGMPFGLDRAYREIWEVGQIGWILNWCKEKHCCCQEGEGRCESGNDIWAETAPLAICKAALKACVLEDENGN